MVVGVARGRGVPVRRPFGASARASQRAVFAVGGERGCGSCALSHLCYFFHLCRCLCVSDMFPVGLDLKAAHLSLLVCAVIVDKVYVPLASCCHPTFYGFTQCMGLSSAQPLSRLTVSRARLAEQCGGVCFYM